MNTYDVAFRAATWGSYGGLTSDMIQGGFDNDQNPIYAPNLDLNACVSVLQQAAFEAGLQIQSQPGG